MNREEKNFYNFDFYYCCCFSHAFKAKEKTLNFTNSKSHLKSFNSRFD